MTVQRVQEIQKTIEDLKEKRTRATAKIEDIEKEWNENYNVNNLEEAKILAKKLKQEEESLLKKQEKLEIEIEKLLEEIDEESN